MVKCEQNSPFVGEPQGAHPVPRQERRPLEETFSLEAQSVPDHHLLVEILLPTLGGVN